MIRFGKRFRLIKKRDLVLYSAILLWLISIVLGSILDPDKHSTILEKVEFIGLSSTVFLALIIGIREFRLNGLRGKTLGYIAVGSMLSLLALGINATTLILVPKSLNKILPKNDRTKKLEVMLKTADLDNERKAFISSPIASEKYQQTGELG